MRTDNTDVLLIAPRGLSVSVHVSSDEVHIRTFRSVAEFDEWRAAREDGVTIRDALDAALLEVGAEVATFSDQLHAVFSWLSTCHAVPHLKRVISRASATRTFYRYWNAAIPESPRRFLDRIGQHHRRL